jgi:hypothetical protein
LEYIVAQAGPFDRYPLGLGLDLDSSNYLLHVRYRNRVFEKY